LGYFLILSIYSVKVWKIKLLFSISINYIDLLVNNSMYIVFVCICVSSGMFSKKNLGINSRWFWSNSVEDEASCSNERYLLFDDWWKQNIRKYLNDFINERTVFAEFNYHCMEENRMIIRRSLFISLIYVRLIHYLYKIWSNVHFSISFKILDQIIYINCKHKRKADIITLLNNVLFYFSY